MIVLGLTEIQDKYAIDPRHDKDTDSLIEGMTPEVGKERRALLDTGECYKSDIIE